MTRKFTFHTWAHAMDDIHYCVYCGLVRTENLIASSFTGRHSYKYYTYTHHSGQTATRARAFACKETTDAETQGMGSDTPDSAATDTAT